MDFNALTGGFPPISASIVAFQTLLAFATTTHSVSPLALTASFHGFMSGQFWRPLTAMFYVGSFGFQTIMIMFIEIQPLQRMERTIYAGRRGDFIYMILCLAFLLYFVSYFTIGVPELLYSDLGMCWYYLWARRSQGQRVHVMFFEMDAAYMGLVIFLFRLLMSSPLKVAIFALIAHGFFFFSDVYPYLETSKGLKIFQTPLWFRKLSRQTAGLED